MHNLRQIHYSETSVGSRSESGGECPYVVSPFFFSPARSWKVLDRLELVAVSTNMESENGQRFWRRVIAEMPLYGRIFDFRRNDIYDRCRRGTDKR